MSKGTDLEKQVRWDTAFKRFDVLEKILWISRCANRFVEGEIDAKEFAYKAKELGMDPFQILKIIKDHNE